MAKLDVASKITMFFALITGLVTLASSVIGYDAVKKSTESAVLSTDSAVKAEKAAKRIGQTPFASFGVLGKHDVHIGGNIIDFNHPMDNTPQSMVPTQKPWKFTAPITGIYSVSCLLRFAHAGWGSDEFAVLYLLKEKEKYKQLSTTSNVTNGKVSPSLSGTTLIALKKGEWIRLMVDLNSKQGYPLHFNQNDSFESLQYNWVTIVLVRET